MPFAKRWEWTEAGRVTSLDIAPDGSAVLAGLTDGRLVMLDAQWGQPRWQVRLPESPREVRCGGEWVVALTNEGSVAVISATGETNWVRRLEFSASCFDLRPVSNLIFLGNGYRLYRQVTVGGSIIGRGEVSHPIDYIRYAPGGRHTIVACADGHVTLLDYGGKPRWTIALKQMIMGADAADRATKILLPARKLGVVIVDINGPDAALIELPHPPLAAEIDDDGAAIVALDVTGRLYRFDTDGAMLSQLDLQSGLDLLALDSSGTNVAVSGSTEPGRCTVRLLSRARQGGDRAAFVEVGEAAPESCSLDELKTRYLEVTGDEGES